MVLPILPHLSIDQITMSYGENQLLHLKQVQHAWVKSSMDNKTKGTEGSNIHSMYASYVL